MSGTPFTEDEKAQIRQVLGFSELFHDIDTRLEQQMADVGNRSPSAQARVRAALARITAIDAALEAASQNDLDLDTAEDGVRFLAERKLAELKNTGRMWINQIAITFEIFPQRDYYEGGAAMSGPLQVAG